MKGLLALLLLAACPPVEAEPEPEGYVQPGPWETLSYDDRNQFMLRLFEPAMRELFVEHDAEAWADFDCESCHGEDPEAIDYAMPVDITPLTFDDIPVEDIEDPERRATGLWMDEEVLPLMAELFEQEMVLEGASCLDCHELQ